MVVARIHLMMTKAKTRSHLVVAAMVRPTLVVEVVTGVSLLHLLLRHLLLPMAAEVVAATTLTSTESDVPGVRHAVQPLQRMRVEPLSSGRRMKFPSPIGHP